MLTVAILAGGLATRLRPLTEEIPKALIDINGAPFLFHQLSLLARSGIDRVVMCVGYRGEQIRDYAGDGSRFGLRIEYSFDGPQLLGTAGAIRRALALLGDSFLVLYGDSYLPCDYRDANRFFVESRKLGLMTVCRNEGNWDTSNVEFGGGSILRYSKTERTPRMLHIDYGLGAFRREAFDAVPADRAFGLDALYENLLERGELAAMEIPGRFYEIGSMRGIADLSQYLAGKL